MGNFRQYPNVIKNHERNVKNAPANPPFTNFPQNSRKSKNLSRKPPPNINHIQPKPTSSKNGAAIFNPTPRRTHRARRTRLRRGPQTGMSCKVQKQFRSRERNSPRPSQHQVKVPACPLLPATGGSRQAWGTDQRSKHQSLIATHQP